MPYNTRRKSLSLPSLGIHLPNASRSHRSPSASKGSSGSSATDEQVPPPKKVKRSHDSTTHSKQAQSQPHLARAAYEHTPPPSPGDVAAMPKIDTDGIHDDVVVAAIHQLEKTGNKPHLVRELAAVLMNVNETVANSANPAALLSSRLSSYMKRSWTALSPCPMGKELINVHPRKVFYYLTTYPHQPLPENLDEMVAVDVKQMTPSISSGSVAQDDDDDDEEEAMARERSRLSPSPEIDLSSPEFEEEQHDLNGQDRGNCDASTPGFSGQRAHRLSHNHRAASPPLEGDEREFTQTASSVRERASSEKASRQGSLDVASASASNESQAQQSFPVSPMDEDPMNEKDDYFSQGAAQNQDNDMEDETVAALFGTSPSPSLASMVSSSSGTTVSSEADSTADGLLSLKEKIMDSPRGATPSSVVDGDVTISSSLKRPFDMVETGFSVKPDMQPKQLRTFDFDMVIDSWSDLRSPETVEVDELDEMFGDI